VTEQFFGESAGPLPGSRRLPPCLGGMSDRSTIGSILQPPDSPGSELARTPLPASLLDQARSTGSQSSQVAVLKSSEQSSIAPIDGPRRSRHSFDGNQPSSAVRQ
jgi:hypothetical protein